MRDLNHSDKRNLIVDEFRDKPARAACDLQEAPGFGGGFHRAGEEQAGLWAVDIEGAWKTSVSTLVWT